MTQFLLAAIRSPQLPDGYEAADVHGLDWLENIASQTFAHAVAIVNVAPIGGVMDTVVDTAREEMMSGRHIQATALGTVLMRLASQCDFALFWAQDFHDLPSASTLTELWEILGPQVMTQVANWELYARFCATSSGRNG